MWTREQYIAWKANRGEPGTWTPKDCKAADMHIKHETMRNFNWYLASHDVAPPLRDLILLLVRTHFGSVEVDDTLNKLGMYPDYT